MRKNGKRKRDGSSEGMGRRGFGAAAAALAGLFAAKPLAKAKLASPVSLTEARHYEKAGQNGTEGEDQ